MNSDDTNIDPVNLGNPGEFTMIELAGKIIELTGSKSELSYHPLPENDPVQRQPDISKAWDVLGWQPYVDLEAGLKETINYFKKELEK
jgi:UDP-glucuronate decarboxylase